MGDVYNKGTKGVAGPESVVEGSAHAFVWSTACNGITLVDGLICAKACMNKTLLQAAHQRHSHMCVIHASGIQSTDNAYCLQVAGPYLTLAGFPPYLVAFSELYHLGCLRTLTEEHVASALARYKRTAQRFGR